ncbi:MAG: agmatinase [Kangiellaceae bacterium]|nr:agmatinase [Kangiellaceae bacterium]MCW8998783.1 agmatinase [Kangiellaceae bacterium]
MNQYDPNKISENQIAVLGICSDHNSSYLRGPAKAPPLIRDSLYCGSANLTSELGVSINQNSRLVDLGDFAIEETRQAYLEIENLISPICQRKALPFVLGGDHSITYPVLKAIAAANGPVNILHFDAHLDLYHEFEGNPYSHACPFARIMESKLAKRLVQVGIRTLNEHQALQAKKFGVEVHQMKDFKAASIELDFDGPVYISIDIDALDPAYAPGVSHFEPGGLSVREIINLLHGLKGGQIVGADIVEYNPERDVNRMTAMVAAKLFKEVAGKMLV